MAAEVLDYYPLLPGELGKQLTDATTAWRSASTSQDAILLPLFTGVKGFEIDVFAVRNNVNTIGRIPIPLCRDIISYAQIFTSIVSVIKDPSTLATSLRILVDQWHQLNTNELASLGDQVTRLLQYDAPKVKSIISELKTLSEVIATWTPDSTDGVFDSSLFDAATPILAPIANFLPTADGITSFADATGLSIQAINIPLKKAFQKPVVGEPIATPDAVFKAIDAALVGRTKKYFGHVNHVVRDVNALVEHLEAVASAALLIPEGLDAFATGQSGSDPVTAEDTVKAWNEASTAADEFVSAIIGRAKSVISEDTPPTSADIEQALGPPSYSASTLFILADQTRKVTDQLRTALALPYNHDIKVKVGDVDISLYEALLGTKRIYEDIQNRTVQIAKNIQTFAESQATVLPLLATNLPMPPSKLFKTWATLAKAYGTHVTRLASDCQVVLEQLQKDISSLRTTLDNAKARIAIDKAELVAAQNTDDVRNALKLIDRIFPVVFTPAAIARAISGEGDIIDELGIVGESYFKAVENSIKAGEVVFLVHKLEKIIATVESTSLQLENTVSVLTGVHGSMEKIGNVWTNDTTSMDIAMNNYSAWRNANLLTLELLETLSSRWGDYRKAADQYANSVFGLKFPNTVNRLALAISGVAEKDLKLATFGTPSDTDSPALKKFYELVNDPKLRTLMAPTTVEDRLEKSKLLLARALDDSLLVESLTAPSITFSINRNALIDVANSYEQAADLLQSVSSSDANRLRDLSSRISTIAIPSIDDSVVYYKDFAQRVIEFVSQPISGESLRAFLSQYLFDTLVGLTKSDGAQQELLTLKNEAALVNNRMVQLKNELQLQLRDAEALYAAHKAELDYYLSLVWIPILGPIIAALYLLISDDIEQMDSLNSKISSIRSAISKVDFVKNIEQVALEVIQELTASWSDLVQKAANLQAFLTVIESTPGLIITLKPQILASWEYLVAELQKWE